MAETKTIQVITLPAASVVLSEEDYECIRASNDRLREALADNERLRLRVDAMALLLYGPAHPDPTGRTRESPHCLTCCCGSDVHPTGKPE